MFSYEKKAPAFSVGDYVRVVRRAPKPVIHRITKVLSDTFDTKYHVAPVFGTFDAVEKCGTMRVAEDDIVAVDVVYLGLELAKMRSFIDEFVRNTCGFAEEEGNHGNDGNERSNK